MGILIELVSVRAGESSKGWRTTESLHVGGRICARAGWKPPEPRSIHLDCCVATLCKSSLRILGDHQVSPAAPHLRGLPSPLQPMLTSCLCLPATATTTPRNPLRNPNGFVGAGVDPTCSPLPSCWCRPSPVPFPHSLCAKTGRCNTPRQVLAACVGQEPPQPLPVHSEGPRETVVSPSSEIPSNLPVQSPDQPALTSPAPEKVLGWRPPCVSSKSGSPPSFKGAGPGSPREQPAQVEGVQQRGHRLFPALPAGQTPFTGTLGALHSCQAPTVPELWPPPLVPHHPEPPCSCRALLWLLSGGEQERGRAERDAGLEYV